MDAEIHAQEHLLLNISYIKSQDYVINFASIMQIYFLVV